MAARIERLKLTKKLCALFKSSMEDKGLHQSDVAKSAGLSVSSVHRWQHHGAAAYGRVPHLMRMAKAIGVTEEEVREAAGKSHSVTRKDSSGAGRQKSKSDKFIEKVKLTKGVQRLLKAKRKAKKMTRVALSKKSGLSISAISSWERGVGTNARLEDIRHVMEVIGITDEELREALGESTALARVNDDEPATVAKRGRPKGGSGGASYCVSHEVTIKVVTRLRASDPEEAGIVAKRQLLARLSDDSADAMFVGFDIRKIQILNGEDGTKLIG